jgi:hypothetical protein
MQTENLVWPIRNGWSFVIVLSSIALALPAFGARTIIGDFGGEIRETGARSDGNLHVDTQSTITRLAALHINTYFFLIGPSSSDWDDFRNEFVPAAAKAGIDSWAYIKPPTECTPTCSLPFGKDYVRWAQEVAGLSRSQSSVKGLVIDDFDANADSFPPQYANQIRQMGKSVNAKFLFYPLLYWTLGITSVGYFERYAQAMDGFIFAYRDEPYTNTISAELIDNQLAAVEAKSSRYRKPFLLMVYCSPVQLDVPPPTPEYVQTVMTAGLQAIRAGKAEGVVTYLLDIHSSPYGSSANPAQHGNGYGIVMLTGKTAPGAYGELNCRISVQPGLPSYALSFWHRSVAPVGIPKGVLSMEVIAGTTILWETDVAAGSSTWKSETVSVPSAVALASKQPLRFVLANATGANVRATVYFDDLRPQGLSVDDPDFENPTAWSSYRTNPAFRAAVQVFHQDQPQRLFGNLSTLYQKGIRRAQ